MVRSYELDELDENNVVKLAQSLFSRWYAQRDFALTMNKWAGPNPPMPPLPKEASDEFKELQKMATTPWFKRSINAIAEVLVVEDHRPEKANESSTAWKELWLPNGLELRQAAVYRDALKHGLSYVSCRDGVDPLTGLAKAVIRGHSAARMTAFYDDAGFDEYPRYALNGLQRTKIDSQGEEVEIWEFEVWDHTYIHSVVAEVDGDSVPEENRWTVVGKIAHGGGGTVPITMFTPEIDNDGQVDGEVEPYTTVVGRINQSTLDRLVVQRFGAWRVRYATGLQKPKDVVEQRAAEMQLMQNELLVSSNPDTKFGTLEPTSLEGYLAARDADIKDFAAMSQVPPHHLLGLVPNLSAEALASAEASQMRHVGGIKTAFATSWGQVFRTASYIQGDKKGALDYTSKVIWRDIESRSMAQIADALGKLAAGLKIPVQMLWERIPGWTSSDNDRALKLLEDQDNLDVLKTLAEGAATKQTPKDAPKDSPPEGGGSGQ